MLAGGQGTRLKEHFDGPKPMCPINNHPFLHYVLQYWASQGASRFIICGGPDIQPFHDAFSYKYMGVPIDYIQETERLGTGGAMLAGFDELKSFLPFLVINGDTMFKVPLKELYATHKMGATFTINYEMQNGGVYIFDQHLMSVFDGFMSPASLENQIMVQLSRGVFPVQGRLWDEEFIQINTPKDVEKAKILLL